MDRITDAEPDLWGAIEDAIFPKVLELRGGLLRSKVEAEVLKADPEAAVKRHRAARTGRNVAIWPAVDGVADLAVRGLSADQAAEAYGNIDAIARAVKATGDTRPLSHLRADVAAALLTGTADITDCSAPTQADPDGTERGGQGHCAVHRFPDHDLHDSWCECGDCSLAPVTSCRVCGAAAKNGVPIHNTAAHSAAQNAAECGTAGGDAAGDNQTEGNAAVENAAAHAGASTSPPWSSSQPSWGAIRTRSKIEATSGVRGPRAGGPRRRATWTTTPNMPAVVQVRWATSRRCARATTRRRVNGTGHSNRPDPANTLSPTPTAANTAARHHPSPPPVTAQPASATTSTAETDDRPPFRNPISRVGRCRDELKSATP
ncbi:hypothetical protein [Actinopolymorpha singaporensis]|uniref:hypothetical protein n=1 Tax=Actinopolymorpha singaporensis TaxID=117157 RepID=UPI001A7E16E3|nr:hypothetical protein [Actinopolymorpha singaporensis]